MQITADSFIFRPMTVAAARQIVRWQYPPPYDVYNLVLETDDWATRAAAVSYLCDPDYRFYTMLLPGDDLAGFCSFSDDGQVDGGDYSQPALDIGMGVRPDLTGQGWGVCFAEAAAVFAQQTFRPRRLRVTIAAFNQRAQRVWRKLGFVPAQRFVVADEERPFIIFVRDLHANQN